MKLYIARHGRTNYNDLDLCNSDPNVDVHLTAVGVEQAETLANRLKSVPIARIFVSELKRTWQTADIVNQFHRAEVEVDPLLNDHRSGYEGKPARRLIAAMDATEDKWAVRFNDGESMNDVKNRVAMFLDELKGKPYDSVLIVTSGWVIRMMVAVIQHISNEEAWGIDAEQGNYLEYDL